MAGSTWPSLVAGAKAKASEVESKFDWIEGDFVPMTGGTKTDNTYDLGETSFRWRDIHFSHQVYAPNGTVLAPSYAGLNASNTGMYFSGNAIYFAANGVRAAAIVSETTTGGQIQISDGTLARPGLAFMGETDLGVWRRTTGEIDFGVGENTSTVQITAEGRIRAGGVASGTDTSTLIYTFVQDPDNGMTRHANNSIGFMVASVTAMYITSSREIRQPDQPAFSAYNSLSDANVTGTFTAFTVEFDTEIFDNVGSYNNATDTFTAPVEGQYLLSARVGIEGGLTTSGFAVGNLLLVTSNRTFYRQVTNNSASDSDVWEITVLADMDAADTAFVQLQINQNTATVDIAGGSTLETQYWGTLIN